MADYHGTSQFKHHGADKETGVKTADEIFVVHWTHIPKAGGSAFSELTRRVACAKNPRLAAINPCCMPKLCIVEWACYASVSSCPLSTGIGRHNSNMDRLRMVPCCGAGWMSSVIGSFVKCARARRSRPRGVCHVP